MARPKDEDLVEVVHRVVGEPRRGETGDDTIFWNELKPDGSVGIMFWTPDDAADRARLERFWEICQDLEWDDGAVHEVVMLEPARSWAMPAPPAAPDAGTLPRAPFEFAPSGLVRRGNRPPAPVAESWRRIEAWAYEHCPEVLVQLRPGVAAGDLDRFEAAIGRALPADVRESWLIHDGMTYVPPEYKELIQGEADEPPCFVRTVFYHYIPERLGMDEPYEAILERWQMWVGFRSDEDEPEVGRTSTPPGAIRPVFMRRGWIPLTNEGGNRNNFLGVDLDPGPNGVVGQVIIFGRDEDHQRVLALSWGQFLEDFADELEAGNFQFRDVEADRNMDMLRPPTKYPHRGDNSFIYHYDAWAEAKLPPEFLGGTPATP